MIYTYYHDNELLSGTIAEIQILESCWLKTNPIVTYTDTRIIRETRNN